MANKLAATIALPSVINNLIGKFRIFNTNYSAIRAVIIAIDRFRSIPIPRRNT